MKFIVTIMFAVFVTNLSAQSLVYRDLVATAYGDRGAGAIDSSALVRKCHATKIGSGVMIAGAGIAVVGVLGLVTPWAKDHDPDKTGAGYKGATAVAVTGVSLAIAGVILHVVGQEHDNNHRRQIIVDAEKKRYGMAWSF